MLGLKYVGELILAKHRPFPLSLLEIICWASIFSVYWQKTKDKVFNFFL